MRIACVGYRKWALEIYDRIAATHDDSCFIIRSKNQYSSKVIIDFKPDIVLFYGWSWIIGEDITSKYKCIMLHPSPLPKYRGGSPIQNQIISGEKKSMVSLFLMDGEMDGGDIIAQEEYSLEGKLDDIFHRITNHGYNLTKKNIIDVDDLKYHPQNNANASYCKRRKPEESELTLDELIEKPAKYLYDKIRMLADPYPNAYIKTSDGKKLIIKEAELG